MKFSGEKLKFAGEKKSIHQVLYLDELGAASGEQL